MHDYIVYVKPNDAGYIAAVNSSEFLPDTTGWVEIARGAGDRYHHAQNNYFGQPIRTDSGVYRYKLVDGKPVECTAEEIAAQEAALPKPEVKPNLESRVDTLESTTDDMVLMLADIIGG